MVIALTLSYLLGIPFSLSSIQPSKLSFVRLHICLAVFLVKTIPETIIRSRLGINRLEILALSNAGCFIMRARPSSGPSSFPKKAMVGSRLLVISHARRGV